MAVAESEPRHPSETEAGAEPVDEIGEVGSPRAGVGPAGLDRVERLGRERGEAYDVEAVTGVEPVLARRLDALAEQPPHGHGIA